MAPEDVRDGFGAGLEISDMLWLVCGDRVALSTRNNATIGTQSLVWDEVIIFEFAGGLKQRIDLYQADQDAVDAFFSKQM